MEDDCSTTGRRDSLLGGGELFFLIDNVGEGLRGDTGPLGDILPAPPVSEPIRGMFNVATLMESRLWRVMTGGS